MAVDRLNRQVILNFRLESGALVSAQMEGVIAFRSEDLVLQNVVNRILQSSEKVLSRDELSEWLTWVTSMSDAKSWLTDLRKDELIEGCEVGSLDLVVLEPSAGAQMAALCRKFELCTDP